MCPECEGGWTPFTVWFDYGDTEVIRKYCDVCHGSGVAKAPTDNREGIEWEGE